LAQPTIYNGVMYVVNGHWTFALDVATGQQIWRITAGEPWGYHLAFDPLTGKGKWKVPLMETASSAGMLATDGGLLFTGLLNGEFIALDLDGI
jgi:outer membrane protein assembly factor BamB